ncbi:hypothetical protein ACRFGX_28735, partial [Klebsiella pneumoniae]
SSKEQASFLDLNLSIENGIVTTKIYDKRDDFDFRIVNFPFLDGDVPRTTSYGVYISQLVRFSRACKHVEDFNERNLCITEKLLNQGYRYHKLRKTFCKFFRRYPDLSQKYNRSLKSLLQQGISQPVFYGDLIYKLKKIKSSVNFPTLFVRTIRKFKKKGYQEDILQRSAGLVIDPSTVNHFAYLFSCTTVTGI